jgi:hypothetical protein
MFKSTIQILQTKQDEEWFVEEGMTWMKFYEEMNKQQGSLEQSHCGMTLPFYGKLKLQTKNFLD